MNIQTLYDSDFNAWIQQNILLLKESRLNEIDTKHLIEELEDRTKSDKRELVNRFVILIAHLLKWQYQPAMQSNSWSRTIDEQRDQINDGLIENPSLKPYATEAIEKSYSRAVKLAHKETKLPISTFPTQCLYTQDQLLDENFYPDDSK
ncbi:MAG: DUF29 domain-containing protein [Methylococcales bacterium]